MKYANSKQFVEVKLNESSSLIPFSSELESDSDDDPLRMRKLSMSFLGLVIAFLTILLPSISIFIGRPLSQENEITSFHLIKKDGS